MEIEITRKLLHDLIENKDSHLTDEKIIALSQLLDKLIYKYYNMK